MKKHWSRFLQGGIGRNVEILAENIESLQGKKTELLRQLQILESKIVLAEGEIDDFVSDEWSREEITKAKDYGSQFNNSK